MTLFIAIFVFALRQRATADQTMKRITLILLVFLGTLQVKGSHLVGGDFSLQHISGHDYELTLHVFRDCEHGIPWFNENVHVGMYDKATNKLVNDIYMGDIISNDTLVFVAKNCIRVPTGCTHIGTYQTKISLDPDVFNSTAGYYFSWERCCRNVIIKNIDVGVGSSGNTGEAWYMEFPPLDIINSTPVFNKDPLTLLCVGNPFTFNYNCTDVDGDSLVYSLVTPLKGFTSGLDPNDDQQVSPKYPDLYHGPYPEVNWVRGYSLNNIMDATSKLVIDPHTGQLSVTPKYQGVYAISIRVEEYRHGKKLGEIRRELQLTISSCANNPAPQYSDSANNNVYTIHALDTLHFPIDIVDPNKDSVFFSYTGTVFPGSTTIKPPYATLSEGSGRGAGEYHTYFNWVTNCSTNAPDTEYVNFSTADNGCPIHRISNSKIKIIILPTPAPVPPQIVCLDRIDTNSLRINFGQLDINKYFAYYLLIRVNPDSTKTIIDTIKRDNSQSYFIDKNAFDNMNKFYKYYFIGINVCGDTGLASYNVYSDPKYPRQPSVRYIISTSVENKKVRITWQRAPEEDFLSYVLYKKSDRLDDTLSSFMTFRNRDQVTFLDSEVDVANHSYCYELIATSKCGYISKTSNEACTILLHGSDAPFESNLEWNPYVNWKGGVAYYSIARRDPGDTIDSINYVPSPTVSFIDDKLNIDWGIYWYKVNAHEGPGSYFANSFSNEVELIQKPVVYSPNVFTPNADSLNDKFGVVPVFVKDYTLRIYNRWGEKVFEADQKHQQWDGNFRGRDNFDNVYVYQIMYTGWDKSTHFMTGNVITIK